MCVHLARGRPSKGCILCVLALVGVAFTFFLALFIYLASDLMRFLPRENKFKVDGRTVVITGGSQGMGRAVAKLLAQKGADVVIVARDKAKLEEALAYISAAAKYPSRQRFHYISADLTIASENVRVLDEVTAWNDSQPPDVVWAVAGSAHPSFLAEVEIDLLRSQMETNYWAAAYLSHAAMRMFLKPTSAGGKAPRHASDSRHIIMTSSCIAFAGLAGYSTYGPAKAAMRNLADCLRQETLLYNAARRAPASSTAGKPAAPPADIEVHIVLPGTILSPGFQNEEKVKHPATKKLEETDPKQTEEQVAAAAVAGLERGKFMIATSWLVKLMRAASIGGSPRDSIVVDTMLSWVASIAWLFVGADLDGKIRKHGEKFGVGR